MRTQCNATKLMFHKLDSREVVGRFDGGELTSDAGGVLLREVEKRTRILGRMRTRICQAYPGREIQMKIQHINGADTELLLRDEHDRFHGSGNVAAIGATGVAGQQEWEGLLQLGERVYGTRDW